MIVWLRSHCVLLTCVMVACGSVYAQDRAKSDSRPAQNAREMLQVMRIDESQLRFFVDDQPIEQETEALERLLFRLPSFAQAQLDRWSKPITELSMMLRDPDSYRFDLFEIRGTIASVAEIEVLPEMVTRLGFRSYYRLVIAHDDIQSIAFVRRVPAAWQSALGSKTPIRETVRLQGLLLKRVTEGDQKMLVLAANRLAWYPSQGSDSLHVSNDQVLLAQLGTDIDRLSEVTHHAPISGKDRECLFQMLASVRAADPLQLTKVASREVDIAQFIREPNSVAGGLYSFEGLARRAIKIHVDQNTDADIVERFGIDHYYEIEVFVPLDMQVRFVDPSVSDDEGKVFTDYPFAVCVPYLPEGMEQGEDIRVPVRFTGFFMKLLAYQTKFMTGDRERTAKPRMQQSPLFIGPSVIPVRPYVPVESQLSLFVATLFVVSLLVVWFLLWRASVKDQVLSKRLFQKHDPADGAFDVLRESE